MSMSKGTSHYNRQVWEDTHFPILCQTCLGENPYMRIMVERFGSQCKVCARPFTTYRWCPGAKMRYKKTEICQTCSRAKNICQTCLLDLQFGLPVQVRDSLLSTKLEMPKSDTNREFFSQVLDASVAASDPTQPFGALKAAPPSDVLTKLARNSPYYKRNRPHVCSFWVKGECKRGEECPYRHEKPTDPEDPLSDQNIKDRYFGVNDPVAEKLLKRASEFPRPVPPEDKLITTIYVGNIGDMIEEKDLRDYFYQFGEIRSITMVDRQNCAFIQYTTRHAAETAVEKSYQKLIIHGQKLTIRWGKSQAKRNAIDEDEKGQKGHQLAPVPGLPVGTPDYFGLSQHHTGGPSTSVVIPSLPPPVIGTSSLSGIHYPSQDPSRMGSVGIKLPSFNKDL